MTGRRALLTLPAALAIGACATFNPLSRDPPRIYRVTAKTTFDPPPPRSSRTLIVEAPTAAAGLNTTRIALRPDLTSLDYYANSLWVDVVPVMLQRAIIDSLDQSQTVDAVAIGDSPEAPDFLLVVYIMAFQADYDGNLRSPPQANVRLQVDLLRLPARERIARVDLQERVAAEGTDIDSIVRAHDAALSKVLSRLVRWTAEKVHNTPGGEARPRTAPNAPVAARRPAAGSR